MRHGQDLNHSDCCYDIDTRDFGNFSPGGGYDVYLIYRNSDDEVGDDDDGNGDGEDDDKHNVML